MIPLLVAIPLAAAFALSLLEALKARRSVLRLLFLAGILGPWPLFAVYAAHMPWSEVAGGWARISGIEVGLDEVNVLLVLAELIVFTAVGLHALRYFHPTRGLLPAYKAEGVGAPGQAPRTPGGVYSLILLAHAGALGALISRDLFNFYVYLELASVAGFILVASSREKGTKEAAYEFLMMWVTASFVFLFAIAIIYAHTGYLNLALIEEHLEVERGVEIALWVAIVSLLVKGGVFPLHFWAPAVTAKSYPPIAALIPAVLAMLPMYRLALLSTYFGEVFDADPLLVIGFASLLAGLALAFRERDVLRLLAFCTVAQMGVVVIGVAAGNVPDALGHLFAHSLVKGGLVLAAGALIVRAGSRRFDAISYRGSPALAAAVLALSLSLGPVQPLVGSVGVFGIADALSGPLRLLFLAGNVGVLVLYLRLNHQLLTKADGERADTRLSILLFVYAAAAVGVGLYLTGGQFGLLTPGLALLAAVAYGMMHLLGATRLPAERPEKVRDPGVAVNVFAGVYLAVLVLLLLHTL